MERNIPEVYVADGHWHTFLIGKNGTATVLSVDRIHNRDIIHPTQDFGGLDVLTISLGGIPPNQAHRDAQTGKNACAEWRHKRKVKLKKKKKTGKIVPIKVARCLITSFRNTPWRRE